MNDAQHLYCLEPGDTEHDYDSYVLATSMVDAIGRYKQQMAAYIYAQEGETIDPADIEDPAVVYLVASSGQLFF